MVKYKRMVLVTFATQHHVITHDLISNDQNLAEPSTSKYVHHSLSFAIFIWILYENLRQKVYLV